MMAQNARPSDQLERKSLMFTFWKHTHREREREDWIGSLQWTPFNLGPLK